MRIARVIGTVTLSRQHPSLRGAWLRIAVPLSVAGLQGTASQSADEVVLCDTFHATLDDRILLSEGPEAAQPFRPDKVPIDAYNAGILDAITISVDS